MSARWIILCALGECLGITGAELWYGGVMLTLGEPEPIDLRLLAWGLMTLSAVPEALILGGIQAWGLRPALPALSPRRYIAATVLPGVLGWGVGGFIPLFLAGAPGVPAPVEPPLAATLLYAAVFGAVAGVLFGACQALALPVRRSGKLAWIRANALGWIVALPLIYLAASLGADIGALPLRVLAWAAGGLAAGGVIGLATWPAVRAFAASGPARALP